jgi:parallel beta-helix repeat protein
MIGRDCSPMRTIGRRGFLISAIALGAGARGYARQRSAVEAVAGIAPVDPSFPPGDVRRYGAALDGETDDTEALTNWARGAGNLTFPVAKTARITGAIPLLSHTVITAVPGATIEASAPDISLLTATGQSLISIRGLRLRQTVTGTQPYVGGIVFNRCASCAVEDCEFDGMQWAGVQLVNSSGCEVRGNYFHDWLGSVQDAADVCIYEASACNVIAGNRMEGGGAHGVLCQDPYTGRIPNNNIISRNTVGRHTSYGIIVYCPGIGGSGDSLNHIVDNQVENIQGSYFRNRAAGAGIYVVGTWAGGTRIAGNRIMNCCATTLQRALAPAGIGIAGIASDTTPPSVTDNVISGMAQGDGILVVSSPGGCAISGGSIELPESNNGTGAGGPALQGCGIRVENSSHVSVNSVQITVSGTGNAMLVYANGAEVSDVSVTGGVFTTNGSGACLRTEASAGLAVTNLMLAAVRILTSSAKSPAVQLTHVNGAVLSEVAAAAGLQPALYVLACAKLSVSGGLYMARGPTAIRTAGNCSASSMDTTVTWDGGMSAIDNAGLAFHIECTGSEAPASGTWAKGDYVERPDTDAGKSRGWRCTAAGHPGTWVATDKS